MMFRRFSTSRAERFDALYPFFPEMRALFRETAESILDRTVDTGSNKTGRRVGVELEFSCMTREGEPLDEDTRNALVQKYPSYQYELGAAQIEIMTPPIDITVAGGFGQLRNAIRSETSLLRSRVGAVGASIVRLGSDPLVHADQRGRSKRAKDRYVLVPDFHRRHRRDGLPTFIGRDGGLIRCDHAAGLGMMSSVQYNLDCHSSEEALQLLNLALVSGPYAVAMGANARFVDGVDSGYADIRGIVWEFSHDIRTPGEVSRGLSGRTGLPTGYFHTLEAYFEDLHDQPSILHIPEAAFPLATGLYWRDARIKFLRIGESDPQIVLEFRPLSIQPTSLEDYAMVAFAVGHVIGARAADIPLLPMPLLHDNRWSAMTLGMDGKLWQMTEGEPVRLSARDVMKRQTQLAENGMCELGASSEEIDQVREIWKDRSVFGSPSDIAFRSLRQMWGERSIGNKPIDRDLFRQYFLTYKDEDI
ncbi:hypothetical protein HY626_01570 [Candidatus Uhrbacteria bacterium]|nr:hypothetical protein [Candidatus Uhrbacteria bacterium]